MGNPPEFEMFLRVDAVRSVERCHQFSVFSYQWAARGRPKLRADD